jgi:hypothetical protein
MKPKYIRMLVVLQFVFLLITCDSYGNIALTNGYGYDIVVHSFYNYNSTIIERFDNFYPRMTFLVAARSSKYENITTIQIETLDREVLANYTFESWIFTEKGLFLEDNKIAKRYEWDAEKILAYYRSDEAVQDLQKQLETK